MLINKYISYIILQYRRLEDVITLAKVYYNKYYDKLNIKILI